MEGKITLRSVLDRMREPSLFRRDMEILIALSSHRHGDRESSDISVEKVLAMQT